MKNLARFLSFLSAFAGLLLFFRSPTGVLGGAMWLPKLLAGAWAPFLALAGGLGAVIGWLGKDRKAAWVGILGALLGIRHTVRVTAPHDHFSQAFGVDWEARIPPELRFRLPKSRYRLIQPGFPPVPGLRDVQIGISGAAQEPLLCDIWEPPAHVPHTGLAVIYLHGGLWQAVDKDFLTQPLFRRLAFQGHVIMDLAYSLAPGADMKRMLGDVKQSIAWMKDHSARYGVDPGRIVLAGEAGGAHLALLAAYTPDHPAFQPAGLEADTSVRAVVSIAGITDLVAFFHEYGKTNPKQPEYSSQITDDLRPRVYDQTWLDQFLTRSRLFPAYRHGNMPGGPLLLVYLLDGTLKEAPEAYRQASPIFHAGVHCPPTLQLVGDNDFIVSVSHGQRLHQALRQAGVPSIYIELPDTVHAFDLYFGVSRRISPAAQAATYDIERFLTLLV